MSCELRIPSPTTPPPNVVSSLSREGVPLPTRVTINPDRSYNLVIHHPTATYFLKQVMYEFEDHNGSVFHFVPVRDIQYIWILNNDPDFVNEACGPGITNFP
jgi:hypothetical protein